MLALLAALSATALWMWREPLELAQLRQGAASKLEGFVARYPDSPEGIRALSEAYLREGRAEDAVRLIQPRLQAQPENPDWHLLTARAYLGLGSFPRARQHADLLERLEPANPHLPSLRALLLLGEPEPEQAEPALRAALAQDPDNPEVLAALGEVAAAQGRLTEAEGLYSQAVSSRPTVLALARLAEIRFRLGNAEAAVATARQALKMSPHHRPSNLWLGRALYALNPSMNAAEAEGALRVALSGPGDASIPRFYLAQLLREQGKPREAVPLLRENVAANDQDKPSHYELMLCYRALGNRGEAKRLLQRLETLNRMDLIGSELEYRVWAEPENTGARMKLIRAYLQYHRPELALPELHQILQRDPGHTEARRLLSELQARENP